MIIAKGYEEVKAQENNNDIIPKPLNYEKGVGEFNLTKDTSIYVKGKTEKETEEINKIAEFIKGKLQPATGFELNIIKGDNPPQGNIYLTTINGEESQGSEGHKMITNDHGVKIIAFKPEGLSRGVQTLIQLLPADIAKNTIVNNVKWSVPSSTIDDKPEYNYRGLMIDVARHFFTQEEVQRQIDLAAQYKINRVHLHFSDDQGWRLEIKKYPELTLIGGSTEVGGGPGGYYTQEQFKEIVAYAAERYVEIIPDFAPKDLVIGIEAPLWTEAISTQDQMDYMIYPRLLGYAEIGWTPKEDRSWAEYKTRLEKQGERMMNEGINYYEDPTIWSN